MGVEWAAQATGIPLMENSVNRQKRKKKKKKLWNESLENKNTDWGSSYLLCAGKKWLMAI